jgi:hypothetical protein
MDKKLEDLDKFELIEEALFNNVSGGGKSASDICQCRQCIECEPGTSWCTA